MKILLAITELGAGGAEKIVAVLAREYIRRGHHVSVLSLQGEPSGSPVPEWIRSAGAEIRYMNLRKWDPRMLFSIRRAVLSERPDIVHSHLIHANLLFRLAMAGLPIPLVNTIHISERRPGKQMFFLLDRLTFRLASLHTAVSDASARFHEKTCGLPQGAVLTVLNGSDPAAPASDEVLNSVRTEWGLARFSRVIGAVGRLDRQKGYDLLLRSLPEISRRIPSGERWGLLLIGDGPESDSLHRIARENAVPNLDVVFGGYRSDAASLMPLFDAFVMPSRYEGYGLALAEAMRFGLPVVCSDIDSLPELCRRYRGFYRLVPLEEGGAFSGNLADALAKAVRAERTEGQVFQTDSGMAEEYLALYRRLRKEADA